MHVLATILGNRSFSLLFLSRLVVLVFQINLLVVISIFLVQLVLVIFVKFIVVDCILSFTGKVVDGVG